MYDCVSLPNAAEIRIELLHFPDQNTIRQAADAIEQLLAENARLKAERDAAVADLKDLSDSES